MFDFKKNCINMKEFNRVLLFFLLFFIFPVLGVYSQDIMVKGVVSGESGETIIGANVKDSEGKMLGVTDIDGKYMVTVDKMGTLSFSCLGYATKKVKVKGQQSIDVILASEDQKMQEVVVAAKRIVDKFIPEKTELEIVGNYLRVTPKMKIPAEMFKTFTRIVAQPVLVNVTRNTKTLFKPVVVNAPEYEITQSRMLEFNMKENDPLAPYMQKSEKIDRYEVIAYKDSLYLENPKDDCRCDIFMFLEDYHDVIYRDTAVIAKGTINPLRFFDYKLGSSEITDEKYIPKPELQLRDDKGEVNLTFVVGKAHIDESNPQNAVEIQKMNERLSLIENDPKANLRSFHITGISSPEGLYDKNLLLAKERTLTAKDRILSILNPSTVQLLKDSIYADARVESWSVAADLMEKDSIPEARDVRSIIEKYPNNPDLQFREISRSPMYRKIIVPNYLGLLRRVEYNFSYSIFRLLNEEEIREIYNHNYKDLSRHEFWKLYKAAKTEEEKETICKRALETYPRFLLAANELAILYINQGRADIEILKPFLQKDAPAELLANQVVALLSRYQYGDADSIASLIPDGVSERVKSIAKALNGNYEKAYAEYAPEGGINEVVLLLALKRNVEAWEKAKELPENVAKHEYVKAIAANRLDNVTEAMKHIKKALELDPSLKEIAFIDGDIVDLLQEEQDTEGNK